MLAKIRSFARSPVANVLMTLLLISFVIWGVRGVATNVGVRDEVIKAGSRPAITAAAFRDQFNFFKQQLEQQNQRPIAVKDLVQHDFDRRVAEELSSREAFAEMLMRFGVRPSDQLIVEKLRSIPAFFNPITGAFDKGAYARVLEQNHLTPQQAEGEIRDDLADRQFESGMAAALRAPLAYSAVQAAFVREGRDFSFFSIEPKVLGAPVKPTDAQLNAFIKENAQRLMKPEQRALSYVRLSAQTLAPTLQISEAEIQKRFDFEKDTLSTPEKRTFQQIPVKDEKTAQALMAGLKGGADPQAVAKAMNLTLVPFADQPRAAIPDVAVAEAAFSMAPGETRGPIKGALGLSVVHLASIAPAKPATLSDVRAKIEVEVRKAAAEDKAYQQVQKYQDVRSGGADMAAAAKAAGAVVATTPPLDAQGVSFEGKPQGVPPKVLQAAFGRAQGQETDAINAGDGDYWIVRVEKVNPPAVPTLDEIRPKLTQYYVMRDTAQRLEAKAAALAESVRKGQPLEAAAHAVGASVSTAKAVVRNGGAQTYSPDLLGKLFDAKPGEVVVAQDVKLAFVVARLDKIDPADASALAPMVVGVRAQASRSLFADLEQDMRAAARSLIKPKVDMVAARKAIGVDDAAAIK